MNQAFLMPIGGSVNIELLEESLYRVFKQDVEIDIVVILNGIESFDLSSFIEKKAEENHFTKLTILKTELKGITYALNLGVSSTNFDIYHRIDADDFCSLDRVSSVSKYLGDYDIIVSRADGFQSWKKTDLTRKMSFKNVIAHSCVSFHRNVFVDLGGYQGGNCQDYDLWLRAIHHDKKIGLVDENLVKVNNHDAQVTKSKNSRVETSVIQFRHFMHTGKFSLLTSSVINLVRARLIK